MLTYSFDNLNGESMYMHLYNCIKNDITNGILHADDKLPSKRALAKNLGISLITVENAYAQLAVEGYIYSLPKRGYYIAPLEQQLLPRTAVQPSPARHTTSEQSKSTNATIKLDFTKSSVPPDSFPYNIWSKVLRQTLTSADEHALLSDTSAAGVLQLRQAIAHHLRDFRGLDVAPEQIVVGAGTQILYNFIVQLLGREHTYALEDPGYPQLAAIYNANNVHCNYLPLDEHGISIDALNYSNSSIAHVMPSHQFPSSIVMPVRRRYELLHWAAQSKDRYIIEDDYDCEFRLYGRPIPPLASIDTEGKVIYINTFSKTLAPTFRISYMLLPRELAARFHEKLGFYSCTVSNFEQFTLAKFIEDGHFERHLARMRTYYRTKRDKVLSYLADCPVAASLRAEGEDSGLHFLLHLATDATDATLKEAALAKGIKIKFLSDYYHTKNEQHAAKSHTLLMNYTGIDDDKLIPALEALVDVLAPYLKS